MVDDYTSNKSHLLHHGYMYNKNSDFYIIIFLIAVCLSVCMYVGSYGPGNKMQSKASLEKKKTCF